MVDLDSKQEHLAVSGFIGGNFGPSAFAWSPDSKWLAYGNAGASTLRNLYVVAAAGGEGKQISFLANTNVNSIQWSPDGKFVLYETGQRTETPEVARIDLTPRQPDYAEQKFDDLFKAGTRRARTRGERRKRSLR